MGLLTAPYRMVPHTYLNPTEAGKPQMPSNCSKSGEGLCTFPCGQETQSAGIRTGTPSTLYHPSDWRGSPFRADQLKSNEEFANSSILNCALFILSLGLHRQHVHLSSKYSLSPCSGPAGSGEFSQHPSPPQSFKPWESSPSLCRGDSGGLGLKAAAISSYLDISKSTTAVGELRSELGRRIENEPWQIQKNVVGGLCSASKGTVTTFSPVGFTGPYENGSLHFYLMDLYCRKCKHPRSSGQLLAI